MPSLLDQLPAKARRGSKPRCHLLTDGSSEIVAARLTSLIAPWGHVSPGDKWMPQGFEDQEEAKLADAVRLLDENIRLQLPSWWLAVKTATARTPNWDIASTCSIGGMKGLLLIEAKAHDAELIGEEKGRPLESNATVDSLKNHDQIAAAIAEANTALNACCPGWNLSRDSRYQMVNRFAWSWKLTELGVPVILVYLGFLNANEMKDRGKPFTDAEEWQRLVQAHSKLLFPPENWNRQLLVCGQPFIPLIRSLELRLDSAE